MRDQKFLSALFFFVVLQSNSWCFYTYNICWNWFFHRLKLILCDKLCLWVRKPSLVRSLASGQIQNRFGIPTNAQNNKHFALNFFLSHSYRRFRSIFYRSRRNIPLSNWNWKYMIKTNTHTWNYLRNNLAQVVSNKTKKKTVTKINVWRKEKQKKKIVRNSFAADTFKSYQWRRMQCRIHFTVTKMAIPLPDHSRVKNQRSICSSSSFSHRFGGDKMHIGHFHLKQITPFWWNYN